MRATRKGAVLSKRQRGAFLELCLTDRKPSTQNSNGLIAFAELGFEIFGHGQSGLLLGGEPA